MLRKKRYAILEKYSWFAIVIKVINVHIKIINAQKWFYPYFLKIFIEKFKIRDIKR